MNKITCLVPLVVLLAPLAASAADGTVTLKGKITEKTCTISTPGGRDFTVTLPTVSADALKLSSNFPGWGTAGRTPFAINLTNCAPGLVATYFEAGPTVMSNPGLVLNTAANRAKDVHLQLLNSDGGDLWIRAVGANQLQAGSKWVEVGPDGTANLNYYVQYYAYSRPTPGEVRGSVNYTIMYN